MCVIGDLTEAEARGFLCTHLLPLLPDAPALTDAHWTRIFEVFARAAHAMLPLYVCGARCTRCAQTPPLSRAPQVCGGNPGALRSCVAEAHALRSWDAGACTRLHACEARAQSCFCTGAADTLSCAAPAPAALRSV